MPGQLQLRLAAGRKKPSTSNLDQLPTAKSGTPPKSSSLDPAKQGNPAIEDKLPGVDSLYRTNRRPRRAADCAAQAHAGSGRPFPHEAQQPDSTPFQTPQSMPPSA